MIKKDEYVWNDIWLKDEYNNQLERFNRAIKRAENIKNLLSHDTNLGDVLELGCGDGSLYEYLGANPNWKLESYTGIDRSEVAINRASKKLKDSFLHKFHLQDISHSINFPHKVNTVIACGVLEHIKEANSLLQAITKILTPNGRLILTMSNTYSAMYLNRLRRQSIGTWPYGYQKNYTPQELNSLISQNFHCEKKIVVHGDWDFPFSTAFDKALHKVNKNVGRYIYIVARPKN